MRLIVAAMLVAVGAAGALLDSSTPPRENALAAGQSERQATIHFKLVDAETGQPTTAMVCLRNLDDDTVRLPPDGRVMRRVSRTEEFYRGIRDEPEKPDWIGPPRMTLGKGDNNDRSYVYEDRPSIPYWREPVMFQTRPKFSVTLDPGQYRISVSRGMEYVPVDEEFKVSAGQGEERTIRLERWVDLPSLGWYSGDVHVHHPTLEEAHRDFLLGYAEAEDLHVVNVLEMGHHRGTDFKQQGFGEKHRVRRGSYCLVSGQEEPRSTFGHIIGLNTTALARDLETYDFYDLAFERLHEQGQALVGFAHFSWNGCDLPRGFPWYVTTEAIDFVELLQFNTINTLDYYKYLNLGFRLTAAAGSDMPWGSTIGEVRTFVHTGEEFDIDAWFEGLRRGHSFVSNGPALELTVDGGLPGTELERERGAKLTVRVRAWGHERVGLPDTLVLVMNGAEIATGKRTRNNPGELLIETEVEVERSRWLAATTKCANGATAHTTPVYVVVGGEPTWSREDGPAIVDEQFRAIARIESEFASGDDPRSQGIRQRLARAKTYYAKLREAMR